MLNLIWHQLNFIGHKKFKELGDLIENKNTEGENMLVLVANLEQIEKGLIRLEFAAHELACKHQVGLIILEFAADEVACKH